MPTPRPYFRQVDLGVWNEWFRDPIDEVRVHDRALTAADFQADMTRPVG